MTRPGQEGRKGIFLGRPGPEGRGFAQRTFLGADTPRTSRERRFCHPEGRSEAEDGAAVDGFPALDRLSVGSEKAAFHSVLSISLKLRGILPAEGDLKHGKR